MSMNWPLLIFLVIFFGIVFIMTMLTESKSKKSSFVGYGEFCKICGKWCKESYEWSYASHKGKQVIACVDCKRLIEIK